MSSSAWVSGLKLINGLKPSEGRNMIGIKIMRLSIKQ
jgi:hypothetical protein